MAGNKTEQSTHYEIGNVSFVITNGFFLKTDTAVFILFILFSFPFFFFLVCVCVCACVRLHLYVVGCPLLFISVSSIESTIMI